MSQNDNRTVPPVLALIDSREVDMQRCDKALVVISPVREEEGEEVGETCVLDRKGRESSLCP